MSAKIVWFEILGADGAKSREFYGELFGWSYDDAPGMEGYGMVKNLPEGAVCGGVGSGMGGPGWSTFYVEVDDVDARLAKANELGGKTAMPPMDLPDGMRIAVFTDGDGHPVGLVGPKAA